MIEFEGADMEWRVIVFAVVCVGALACLWRGGPCSVFFKRCREGLRRKLAHLFKFHSGMLV